ncbi:MAG: discoidin domain-containing protein [Firmicutes bacterium]|nr:discoidin domain-containing protein [Bacillota bacterium]
MKISRLIGALIIAVILALAIPAAAYANSAYLGAPGFSLKYQESSDIVLEKQVMQIWLHRGFAEVESVYQLYNTGDAQEFAMGLPDEENTKATVIYGIYNFRAFLDGKETDVRTVNANEQTVAGLSGKIVWHTHNVFIPKNERRIVVERYWIRLDPWKRKLTIPLQPGASWKGGIGEASYVVHFMGGLSDRDIKYPATYGDYANKYAVQPAGFTVSQGELKWNFSNYKPNQDLEILIFGRGKNLISDVKASGAFNDDGKEYLPKFVADQDPATAWGIMNSNLKEWLIFDLGRKRWIREFRIIPGFASLESMYKFYNRPSSVTLRFSDGSSQHFRLQDSLDMQYFSVKPVETSYVKLEVDDVYKGIYSNVTYISEIEFGELQSQTKFEPSRWKIGLAQADSIYTKPRYSIVDAITVAASVLVAALIIWQVVVSVRARLRRRDV